MINKQRAVKAVYEAMKFPVVPATRFTSSTKSTNSTYSIMPLMFKHDNGLGEAEFNRKMSNEVINSYQK